MANREQARIAFIRQILVSFLVVAAVLVGFVILSNRGTVADLRDLLEEHEQEEAQNRERVIKFVDEEHDQTRKEIARFRSRIAQLENFIIKKGFEVPSNGSKLTAAGTLAEETEQQTAKEGPKPGTPGGPPDPPPPHQPPESPGPPVPPGPSVNPPLPTPFPTDTCVDLPPPLEDFCV